MTTGKELYKKAIAIMSLAISGVLYAGTCTYSFGWFKNAAVTDFNVPLVLQEGQNGFTYAGFADAAGGTDLRITDSDGTTLLPYEIETWDPQGTSIVWVKVPSFSSATTLTLTWGDASAAEADPDPEFWPDALAVMHFGDTPGKNSVNGDVFSGTVASTAAHLGKAADFTRTGNYILNPAESNKYVSTSIDAFTFSFWLNTDHLSKSTDQTYLVQMGAFEDWTTQFALLLNWDADAALRIYCSRAGNRDWGVPNSRSYDVLFPRDGKWHHIAVTYDGTTFMVYCDGNILFSYATSGFSLNPWSVDGYFSVGGTRTGANAFYGQMDEFRFETTARSAEWIRAAAETQSQAIPRFSTVIKFSDYEGAAPLTNFPAYIQLDENNGVDIGAFYTALTNGTATVTDYRTGELLPLEIECVFNNAFGRCLGFWAKMPRYSREDGVVLSMPTGCYVPNVVGNPLNASGVWDADEYRFVCHMNPNASYLCDVVHDIRLVSRYQYATTETGNTYGGTSIPIPVQGPTGPYSAYRTETNMVQTTEASLALNAPLTNVWTVSWWMKEDDKEFRNPKPNTYVLTMPGFQVIMGSGYRSSGADANKMVIYSDAKECQLTVPDVGWHHYAYATDGTKTYCYRDGVLQKTVAKSKNLGFTSTITGHVRLMSSSNAYSDAFIGEADEIRLEAVCRDADWVRACWRNQLAWREGTPWQFVPHFADEISDSVAADGTLAATASLVCRTNATVTLFWGRTDAGQTENWDGRLQLGTLPEGPVAGVAALAVPGARYAYRFRAENEHGTAWTKVRYVTVPAAPSRVARVNIAISYAGTETLTNFPVCVRIPAANDLPAETNGVRFLDETGRVLAWEVEKWNPGGTSVVWVAVPRLTAASALTMQFGRRLIDDGSWDADSLWDPSEYVGVWHFAQAAVSGDVLDDSTSFGARIRTNTLKAYETNGVVGAAFHWPRTVASGGTAQETPTPFADFRDGFTFSIWIRLPEEETPTVQYFVKEELKNRIGFPSSFYFQFFICYNYSNDRTIELIPYIFDNRLVQGVNGQIRLYNETGTLFYGNVKDVFRGVYKIAPPDDGWHHYVFSHDGKMMTSYRDGELVHRAYWPFVLNQGLRGIVNCCTAFGNEGNSYNLALATLDEYRAERTGRSAAWIKACYDNQKPDSTFVTVGATIWPGTTIIFR